MSPPITFAPLPSSFRRGRALSQFDPGSVVRVGDLRAVLADPALHDNDLTNIVSIRRMSGQVGPGGLTVELANSRTNQQADEDEEEEDEDERRALRNELHYLRKSYGSYTDDLRRIERRLEGKLKTLKKLGFAKGHAPLPVRPLPLPR